VSAVSEQPTKALILRRLRVKIDGRAISRKAGSKVPAAKRKAKRRRKP
jgi:hypothetical protein